MLVIIVEGPDGAGKDTFIKSMVNKLGEEQVKIKHFGVPKDATKQVGMYIQEIQKTHKPILILNRCWYSDMIYGPVMRGASGISYTDCRILEEYVKSIGRGIVIYLTSDIKTLWQRCEARGEDYIKDASTLAKISNAYTMLFDIDKVPTLPVLKITT